MIGRDPHDILGVPRDASAETIHHAYRNLAKYWHPDLNPGNPEAEERFKEVAAAYEILSSPERRAQYDRDNPPPPSEAHQGERPHYSPGAGYFTEAAEAAQGERPHYSPDAGYSSATAEAAADLGAYVEKVRDERDRQKIRPNLWLVTLAVWIGLAFVNGMVRGFATDLDGVIVSATENRSAVSGIDELIYTGPVDIALYLVGAHSGLFLIHDLMVQRPSSNVRGINFLGGLASHTEFTIRSADGHSETFKPGPACSFLSGGAAIGSRIHKEAWGLSYTLDGRLVSDLPFVGPRDDGLNGFRRVNCLIYGPVYPVSFILVLAFGLLWRRAWTEAWQERKRNQRWWERW